MGRAHSDLTYGDGGEFGGVVLNRPLRIVVTDLRDRPDQAEAWKVELPDHPKPFHRLGVTLALATERFAKMLVRVGYADEKEPTDAS